jgi:hypothetical protein
LSERQTAYLEAYGYPHVLDEFRFHMTLTGPVHAALRPRVVAALAEAYAVETRDGPVPIDALALFGQASAVAPFKILGRWALTGRNGP